MREVPDGARRALVTGAQGFLGRRLVLALKTRGYDVYEMEHREGSGMDGRDIRWIKDVVLCYRPDVIFHLAARCGGIGANQRRPGEFFYDNMLMGMNVMEAARPVEPLDRYYLENGGPYKAPKIVMVGTVCSYPKMTSVPFEEESLWGGYPEETNAAYGVAKRALITMAQAYRQQYGMNIITLIPANLYGPGDNFDLEDAHVIPAMIRKYEEARRAEAPEVELWGTGRPTREFLYVDDCAEALIAAAERYDGGEPVNLGTGLEIPMSGLAVAISAYAGYHGRTVWDASKPDGQPRRSLDTSKARELFGWKASTSLADGLKTTISWYRQNWAAIALGDRP